MNPSLIFIARPVATTLLTIGVILAGIIAFRLLPVSPLPAVDFPTISVNASLPGASPATIAATVATPLERSLGQIAGITEMTSTSSLGQARVTLQFDLSRDIDGAARDVQAAINNARTLLPSGLPSNPSYRKANPSDAPIMILALTSQTMTRGQMYDAADTILAQKLSQVPGVGAVDVGGSSQPAVRVELNPRVLDQYGISTEQVRTAITATNANRPKGAIEAGERHWQIGANDQANRASEYRPIVVAYKKGAAVLLRDLAEVTDSVQDVRNAGLADGKPAVLLIITRQPNANIIDTVDRIKAQLPRLRATISSAIDLSIMLDRTPTIRASLNEVERTLITSVILVVLVVFVFLRRVSASLIPCVAVPVSLIGTFGIMYLAGFTIDNLSLMALTIATGFVVDDAVVVLENISRHIEEGMQPLPAALRGAREVGFTVLSMSVSLVAVFIPILVMGGIVGRLFREFALTLSVAIGVSLLVSLSTTPMMCAYLLKNEVTRRAGRWQSASKWAQERFERLLRGYERSLHWALAHRPAMMIVLLFAVCLNVYLYIIVPKTFFPQQDTGRISGNIQGDQSISFESMQRKLVDFMTIVRKDPSVANVVGFIGGGQTNAGRMFISLKPLGQRKESADGIIARLRIKLAREPGATLFLQPVQDIRIGGRASNAQFQYTVQADDLNQLRSWEVKIRAAMSRLPQLVDVNTDAQEKGNSSYLVIDRDAASRFGVTAAAIDTTLNNLFGQRQVSTIFNPLNQYRVVMEADPKYSQTPESLQQVYVTATAADGTVSVIPLSAIAHYESRQTALSVNHQGQFAASTISFGLPEKVSLSQATAAIETAVGRLGLPNSVRGSFQGTAQAFRDSLKNQPLLILAALVAVYIVLGILYESYVHPLTILSTLPSAGVGALLALLATGTEFSIMALIGVILLIGIVKKNAIMMIDFALDAQRTRGKQPIDAIFEACVKRFRPIMMTTMAALFGALPLALRAGDGAELRRPLGISIAGGLIVSQLLTLYTTPVVYLYLDRFQDWLRAKRSSRAAVAGARTAVCLAFALFVCASIGGCAVGPHYVRPKVDAAEQFKESQGWSLANPQDHLPRGDWWKIYADADLDRLMEQVNISNQNIRLAEAQFRAARALSDGARANFFPIIGANASATRNRGTSKFSSTTGTGAGTVAVASGGGVNTTYNLSFNASWELDVWGRLRRASEGARAGAAASEADLAAARLSAQADLAQNYFQIRDSDAEKKILDENIAGLQKSLSIVQNQYAVGVAKRSDVAQATAQLKATQAQALDIQITRAQLEHAIAVLIGQPASKFSLEPRDAANPEIPVIPTGIPSELLQRRPDIAAAERRVAAANAQIGVAEAAYFPSLSLSGSQGYASSQAANLVSAANRIWSVGPLLALNLFDAGARRATTHQAVANYDASVATYRETVLTAFQGVEDNLTALRILGDEVAVQDEATQAARESQTIALNQYKAGIVSYLNVVIAQSTALADERSSLNLRARKLVASVALIRALGGGWVAPQR